MVTDRHGKVLAISGDVDPGFESIGTRREIQRALAGGETAGFWPQSTSVLQVVAVPIAVGIDRPELLGTLALGFRLDDALAERFKRVTESDIAFAADGQIKASTLPPSDRRPLLSLLNANGVQTMSLGDSQYVALTRPLATGEAAAERAAPSVLILRSRTERLRFLNAIHTGLAATAVVAVLLATILSYAVARTITRPMATISDVMREMSATGDLTRKISMRRAASWEDEDAKLLATTFNTLTDSIARFQREAAQRERLSSLGRLSTVVAHEIRNPLMIIKASLRTLGSDHVSRGEMRQALTDVDEEVARLNRVVNDVLDFARPIRFDYAPTDVNAVCADAEHATRETAPETDRAVDDRRHAAAGGDRRRAPAHGAREHPDQRAPCRGRSRRWRRALARGPTSSSKPCPAPTATSPSSCGIAAPASSRRTWRACSTHTSRPSAPAPASGWPSPRTSSKAWGDRSCCAASRARAPKSASIFRTGRASHDGRGTLLLVDDEQKIRRVLGQALRAEGHDVLEAAGAREAQRMLAERAVDVLIIDNLMPDMTGLDLIKELVASTPETERPQILMMTAHATIESAIEAMKLGALDFLQKPFEVDELLVVVRRALDHQRLSSASAVSAERARRRVQPLRHRRAGAGSWTR